MKRKIDYDCLPDWAKSWDFIDMIESKCKTYEINPYHIIALVKTESDGNKFAMRYEKDFKWTSDIATCAFAAKCTQDTMEMMQKTSWGLCQVMGVKFYELGGSLEYLSENRTPAALLNERLGLEYGCRAWRKYAERYINPEKMYAAYNAGSVRYDKNSPTKYVNQNAVDNFMSNLRETTKAVRF